jgi:hypothetical protein
MLRRRVSRDEAQDRFRRSCGLHVRHCSRLAEP